MRSLAVAPTVPADTRQWKQLVDEHLAKPFSENTRAAYRRDLDVWTRWCSDRRIDPLEARQLHLLEYRASLERDGCAAGTVARRLAAMASVYRAAAAAEIIDVAPTAGLSRPTAPRRRFVLSALKAQRIVEAAEEAGTLEAALVALVARCKMRISDACSASAVRVTDGDGRRLVCVDALHDGSELLTYRASPSAARAIDAHVGDRESGLILVDGDPLEPLDRYRALRVLKRVVKAAGLPSSLTSEDLRRARIL